jgi:hypothetical protein
MNKYEQLIEHIINDETDKARELFHNIVVEKSRDIYESLIDEQDLAEVGGNQVEDLVDEVTIDEQGLAEEDEEGSEMDFEVDADAEDSEGSDMDFDDSGDLDSHEEEHASDEERISDLESALDELKAEFDALMADEAGEEEHADMMGGDEFGAEEEQQFMEAEECAEDEEDEEELDETIVREYVEKVTAPSNKSEGGEVGKGGSANVNKQSTVAKANNMGGTSANIVKGGTATGGNVKKPQEIASGNINVPGGKAGSAFKTKQSAKTGEGQTTDGKVAVGTKSPLAK